MIESDLAQLLDLFRILSRYSSGDWKDLALILRDKEGVARLAEVAEILSLFPNRQSSKNLDKVARTKQTPLLRSLERSDAVKFRILSEFRNELTHGRLMRTTGQLHDFASGLGLKLPERATRSQIVSRIVQFMAEMETTEIESKLKSIPTERDVGGEFSRWVKIILERSS